MKHENIDKNQPRDLDLSLSYMYHNGKFPYNR